MKHHPDRNAGNKQSEEEFKKIKEAYDILSDAEKRKMYDQFGHAGVNQQGFGGGGGPGMNVNFEDVFGDIGDIFGDIFGGGGRSRGRRHASGQPGAHLRYELTISLEEAVFGATRQIKISTLAKCKTCDGSGAKKAVSRQNVPNAKVPVKFACNRVFFNSTNLSNLSWSWANDW